MLKFSVLLFSSMFCLSVSASENNLALQDMFESDQAERSEENMAQGIFPSFADEIGRRLFVFEAMSKGELTSADDFFHAAVILQHTNLEFVGEELKSMSSENHLLAFFLAKRADKLGHTNAKWLIAATYNRYLEHGGKDTGEYGLRYQGGSLHAANPAIADEHRVSVGLPPVDDIIGEL